MSQPIPMIICGCDCGCDDDPFGHCIKEKTREELEAEVGAWRRTARDLSEQMRQASSTLRQYRDTSVPAATIDGWRAALAAADMASDVTEPRE